MSTRGYSRDATGWKERDRLETDRDRPGIHTLADRRRVTDSRQTVTGQAYTHWGGG